MKPRGFAAMSKERQREIASKGGKAAHEQGTAHEFRADTVEAREAGRKGGTKISQDSQHMAEIGRLGGRSKSKRAADDDLKRETQSRVVAEMAKGHYDPPLSEEELAEWASASANATSE